METMPFGPLTVRFDARVLRPRPWTYAQSLWAVELLSEVPPGPVLELCAGVGHIGLAVAAASGRHLVLVDADRHTCDHARWNADAAGLAARVSVRHGPMQDVLAATERFPMILADPPWVPAAEISRFPSDPSHAIDGGPDGLDLARICAAIVARHLSDDGVGVLQLRDDAQAEEMAAYLEAHPALDLHVVTVRDVPGAAGILLRLSRVHRSGVRGSLNERT